MPGMGCLSETHLLSLSLERAVLRLHDRRRSLTLLDVLPAMCDGLVLLSDRSRDERRGRSGVVSACLPSVDAS